MREHYDTDIIKEKIAGGPFLLEGESIAFEAKSAFSFFHWSAVIVITFVPPFIWGILLFSFIRHRAKQSGVWITNKRMVHFEKNPLSKVFQITSIPLSQITRIEKSSLAGGPSDILLDLLNRMVGVADVLIFLKDSAWARHGISDVRGAGRLIRFVHEHTGGSIKA